jgi:tetratricopeptide (TPR) repeat protein
VRRPRFALHRRLAARASLVVGLLGGAASCQRATPPVVVPKAAVERVAGLDDARFAESAHQLLVDGKPSEPRSKLLTLVVRTQLVHAGELFARGDDVRGAQAVIGAFMLLGSGEARGALLDATSLPALDGAIRRFSARGEEGRTLALLSLKQSLVGNDATQARAIAAHIDALRQWKTDTRTGGAMHVLSAEQREAVMRALLEPNDDHVVTATRAVERWIERAVAINVAFQETRQLPEREEAIEAFRALQTGAYVMAAIHLRQGRFADSLQAVESGSAARVARPNFFAKLRAAAVEGRAEDVRALARELNERGQDPDSEEESLDPDVLHAALWGTGVEAYRRDPKSLAIAFLLATQLVTHEMPEVAPLVLRQALGSEPSASSLNGALELVAEVLSGEETSPTTFTARRLYASAATLLDLAETPAYLGKLRTSAARVRQLMAALELRAGNPASSRELMIAAARLEPTVGGLTALATLERQLGDARAARATADRAAHLFAESIPSLEVANAHLVLFELARDAGDEPTARRSLDAALAIALDVRRLGGSNELGLRAETMLARIFDGYGEHDRANRAMARALDLADLHRPRLAETMLAAIGRAVVLRDLSAARLALGLGIKADTDRDSLVYGALWVGELERQLGEGSDGKVSRVFAEAVNGEGWTSRLARWARASLTDAELTRSAKTHADRVEAEFYTALRAHASRAADGTERLRKVAHNPLIDLYEVRLARDLLAPRIRLTLPRDAILP